MLISQLSQMSAALLAGFFGGLAFDIYQKLCYGRSKRHLRLSAYLKGDAIFALFLISSWLIFWFLGTDGSLRLSVFLWLGGGFALYMGLVSKKIASILPLEKLRRPHFLNRSHEKERGKFTSLALDKSASKLLQIHKKVDKASSELKFKVKEMLTRKGKEEKEKQEEK